MKIAQVCPYDFSRPGGIKNHILGLSKALTSMGHEVHIITPIASGEIEEEVNHLYQFGKKKSTTSRSTKIDLSLAVGGEVKGLRKHLAKEQYDIIHYHNGWTPFLSYQVRLFSFFKKSQHVATYHDTPPDSWFGRNILGKILMPFGAFVMCFLGKEGISVSQSQSKFIKPGFFKPLTIIPNGIEQSIIDQSYNGLEAYQDGKFNLLFLGRLEPRKGVQHALEAFAKLKSKHSQLRLLVAGGGDGRQEAEAYAKSNELEDVHFLGFVDEKTKADLLKMADVFLAPALYGESFGIVLLEAMAAGTAMAGYGNQGYLNIIDREWRIFFPEPGNLAAFVDSIEMLYLDGELRNRMEAWGRETVQLYSWDIIGKQVLDVYKRVLKMG